MGAWGTSLYANDTTCDIRGDYVDKLKRGKSNKEATMELISQNKDIFGNAEEEPLFWYALADTQWNYGRLLPEVKEKALFFLDQPDELERWSEAGENKLKAWLDTLTSLKEKLHSTMPSEKKVSKYRFYHCTWKLGDTFAYRLESEFCKANGLYGKYIAFRKIGNSTYWPGHTIPIIQVYNWIGTEVPTIGDVTNQSLLILGFVPKTLEYKPNIKPTFGDYLINIITTSAKMIPQKNLVYLGNLPGKDFILETNELMTSVGWEGSKYNKTIEKYIGERYLAWNDFDLTVFD